MATLTCPDVPNTASSLASYDEQFDAFSDLIAAALSCDDAGGDPVLG